MRFFHLPDLKSPHTVFLLILVLSLCIVGTSAERALASQGEDELTAKLVEGAKKEGQLQWYFSMTVPEADTLAKKFQEKYPFIKVGLYRANSERLLPRIVAEDQAKKYVFDVLSAPAMTGEFLKRKNLIAKYLSPQGKYYPQTFKDPEGYWIASFFLVNILTYNTRLVPRKDVPKTYEDLLDPKWKGKMVMDTGAFDWFAGIFKIMGEEKGMQFMKRLSEQNIQFRSGRTLVTQMVAAGERSIATPVYNQRVEWLKADGAPIDWVPLEPIVSEVNPPVISAHAPHGNAARLFVDFLLSKEGQETIASFYRLPTREDVEARVPRAKCKGLKILPFDSSIGDNYGKYIKLYREVLMKK